MLARPPLGDRNGRDTGYMQARQLPPSGAGEGGPDGKGTTDPSYNDALRRITDLEGKLAAATNTIAQTKAIAEKFTASRQANWEKRQAKRGRDELNSKSDGAGPANAKKTGQAGQENVGPGARGFCLRISPASNHDSDQHVENHARLFLLREDRSTPMRSDVSECKQDAPQSPLPPPPPIVASHPSPNEAPEKILSVRERNTRILGEGISYDQHVHKLIWDGDIPQLVDIDEDNEEIPPIDCYPNPSPFVLI